MTYDAEKKIVTNVMKEKVDLLQREMNLVWGNSLEGPANTFCYRGVSLRVEKHADGRAFTRFCCTRLRVSAVGALLDIVYTSL
jgi:hypothetical protein